MHTMRFIDTDLFSWWQ